MRFFNSPVLVPLPPTIGKVPRGFADNGDSRPAVLNGVISFRAGAFVDSLAARTQDAEPASASAIHKVAILLCTYDGQHYLAEQLNSFASQEHTNWELWVSDDD